MFSKKNKNKITFEVRAFREGPFPNLPTWTADKKQITHGITRLGKSI